MLDSPFINLSLVLILYLPYFQDPEKSLKFTLQLEIWALPQNRSMCSHIDGLAWKESKVRRTRRSNWKPKDVACLSHCLGPDTDTRLLILMDNRWHELVVLYPPRGHFYCLMNQHPILLKFNSIIRLQALEKILFFQIFLISWTIDLCVLSAAWHWEVVEKIWNKYVKIRTRTKLFPESRNCRCHINCWKRTDRYLAFDFKVRAYTHFFYKNSLLLLRLKFF